ncbi:MAG TPA: transglutaminase-like domain-containing protein [Vicinamibacterales bacterium]|nr:transglutaminase-like domain-containing protein [Vicinamibacterales bacterium]
MLSADLVRAFTALAHSADPDLAEAALLMARVAYPDLDAAAYIDRLDDLGREARRRVVAATTTTTLEIPPHVDPDVFARIVALNEFLFEHERFAGNDAQYDDPRNSFLNEVLDRRTGIPITLALVYMEVARRAGIDVEGVNFPGHFLLRCRGVRGTRYSRDLIIDAHHGGALLSESMCRDLLTRHSGDDAVWDAHLLSHATKLQIITRMLLNLKRAYVRLYSFQQARDITQLLLAVDPAAVTELRDRGLLAYHLNDLPSALRDLQTYLQLSGGLDLDEDERDEHARIWEHVKTLRRRVASFN